MPRQQVLTGSEGQEQEFLFDWVQYQSGRLPELRLLYHVPNGGKRDKRTAINLKRQGVKAGVPDLVLPVPRGGYHGAYVELKVNKNKTTDLQKMWLSDLEEQGYFTAVCYGWKEAANLLESYIRGDLRN
jgi:hypothetical protein